MSNNAITGLPRLSLAASIVAVIVSAPAAIADEADETTADSLSKQKAIDEIIVTGSRLAAGDKTATTFVFDSEDIEMKGLTSAEDILRYVPQNFSSMNSTTNLDPISDDASFDSLVMKAPIGISSANLNGLGSANTLVLVNGRRIAGVAGNQNGFANLSMIPASAIERVEIQTGASAVYGSDAIGGVVNFILKKNFQGGDVSVFAENSNNDADLTVVSGYYGFGWGSGNASVTASWSESDPINNHKAGWTTYDQTAHAADPSFEFALPQVYQDYYGATPAEYWLDGVYNLRQPGWFYAGPTSYSLPVGDDGTGLPGMVIDPANPTAPFVPTSTLTGNRWDFVPVHAGPERENKSITLNVEQQVTERISVYADFIFTEASSYSEQATRSSTLMVPASNAYNPFGQDVRVYYTPQYETETGMIPAPYYYSENEQYGLNAGFRVELAENHEMVFNYGDSESRSKSAKRGLEDAIGDYYSYIDEYESFNARAAEIMADSNPDTAPNFFGDGTAQNESIRELIADFIAAGRNKSITESTELTFVGQAFSLPGGSINYAVGAETRKEGLRLQNGQNQTYVYSGSPNPTRELDAYFAEVSLPLISDLNAKKFAHSLTLVLQARNDDYAVQGADGRTPEDDPNLVTQSYDATTTRYGLAWEPMEDFVVRLARSESFRAPVYTDLFRLNTLEYVSTYGYWDTLNPGGPDYVYPTTHRVGNLDARPERGETTTIGIEFAPEFVPGLHLKAEWMSIDYFDRLVSSTTLRFALPQDEYLAIEEIHARDENGVLTDVYQFTINQAKSEVETVTYDIKYTLETGFGTFMPRLAYHRYLKVQDQYVAGGAINDTRGKLQAPPKSTLTASLDWYFRDFSANIAYTKTPGYLNDVNWMPIPAGDYGYRQEVDGYETVDVAASYTLGETGLTFRGGVRNLFDEDPPFAYLGQGGRPFDGSRVDLRGRVAYIKAAYAF